MSNQLSHIDHLGKAKMVNVGHKGDTDRTAIAEGFVLMKKETLELIQAGLMKKGDVLTVAQLAGIMGAKHTPDLIPLCHPLILTHVQVELEVVENLPGIRIVSTVSTTGKTGVEMEALTAVSISALTIYDMAKAVEKTMVIKDIHLLEKHGGKSGDWVNT
jgi:cyclic pyranopterin phosphate synthase